MPKGETSDAPDRIEFPPAVSAETIRLLTVEHHGYGTAYLRETPARAAADQMLEALHAVEASATVYYDEAMLAMVREAIDATEEKTDADTQS